MNYLLRIISILFLFLLLAANNLFGQSLGASRVQYGQNSLDVYVVNFPADRIQMFWKDDKGQKLTSLASLKKYAENKKEELVFATNAGMYMPDNSPEGLYVENGKELI